MVTIFSYIKEKITGMMISVDQEKPVNPDQLGPLDQRERTELLDPVALLEQLAYQVILEQPEQRERKGQQELMVTMETQGQQEV